jgi:hypothetical protein
MPLFIPGFEKLASSKLVAAGASISLTIPPRDILWVVVRCTGLSVATTLSLQFNGDTTAANYSSCIFTRTNAAPPVDARTATTATAGLLIGVSTAINIGRLGSVFISNNPTNRKVAEIHTGIESTTTTAPSKEEGWGEWLNTTARITTVLLKGVAASNLNAGTGLAVFGANLD